MCDDLMSVPEAQIWLLQWLESLGHEVELYSDACGRLESAAKATATPLKSKGKSKGGSLLSQALIRRGESEPPVR